MPPYTTAVIQAKLENATQLAKERNYMIKAHSEFIDNNLNLRCYPTLINNNTHNYTNALPLIITYNSGNKVCIPEDIT